MPGVVGEQAIRLDGLRELQTAFRRYNRAMHEDFRVAFMAAGEPVRVAAEALAVQEITRIGIPWSRMRIGFTKNTVYVAPVARGVKSRGRARFRRPKLKDKLLDQAMYPAVDRNLPKVITELEDTLEDLAKAWART